MCYIAGAMVECLDAGRILCHQTGRSDNNCYLMRCWYQESGQAAVATIPMSHGNQTAAIIALRHLPDRKFTESELVEVQKRVARLLPGMLLLGHISVSPVKQLWKLAKQRIQQTLNKGQGGVGLAIVLFTAWFLCGTATYRVTVPCSITSKEIRHVAAPYQATLAFQISSWGKLLRRVRYWPNLTCGRCG